MSTELYERGIKSFLKEHNWPPGNSQTLLTTTLGKPQKQCSQCKKFFPILHKVKFVSGLTASVCGSCLEVHKKRNVVKKVL
jgi:hypothetical protein